jgi:hypothetical protein
MRIAHIKSARVGWRPPRIQGRVTVAATPSEPRTSVTTKMVEPVILATLRTWVAVSTLATMSTGLRARRSSRGQIGSMTTRVSGSPIGIA